MPIALLPCLEMVCRLYEAVLGAFMQLVYIAAIVQVSQASRAARLLLKAIQLLPATYSLSSMHVHPTAATVSSSSVPADTVATLPAF